MVTSIYDFPPVERKYVAVRRYKKTIGGEKMFNRLLERLGLSEEEFIQEHGEELIGNPTLFHHDMVEMMSEDFKTSQQKRRGKQ